MNCWNFSLERILKNKWYDINYDQEYILSEYYPDVSLLPKIWKILLKSFPNVLILHENTELFINIETEDETDIANEYREELYDFISKWWKFWCNTINTELINELLSNKFYCIIPINKENAWTHFVILTKENDAWKIFDNSKWEYTVSEEELNNLMNIKNWKYILFCWDYIDIQQDNSL